MKLELSDFSNVLQVPMTFEVVSSPDEAIEKIVTCWPFMAAGPHRMLILCGSGGNTRAMAEEYRARLASASDQQPVIHEITFGSIEESREVDALCATLDLDLLVAIGGGRVVDTAKMVAYQRRIALLCIPSVLSSDGITSPVSVLLDETGRKRSLASGIPACVVVDLSLTRKAPLELTKAGIGDLLSNASALLDLEEYEAAGLGIISGFAKLLSYSAYQLVVPLSEEAINDAAGQEAIAKGLILSGLSMAFSGNSLPCSGAEHLISHALDDRGVNRAPHGLQVAVATLYCLGLREHLGLPTPPLDMRSTVARLGLPGRPEQLGLTREQFLDAVRYAPTTRPGRCTVLDRAPSEDALQAAYDVAFR